MANEFTRAEITAAVEKARELLKNPELPKDQFYALTSIESGLDEAMAINKADTMFVKSGLRAFCLNLVGLTNYTVGQTYYVVTLKDDWTQAE